MSDEARMLEAIGETLSQFGVKGLSFEDEHGNSTDVDLPPHEPAMMPVSGYGDTVKAGDWVRIFSIDTGTHPHQEHNRFHDKQVQILEISASKNFCLCHIEGETGEASPSGGFSGPTSFALQGSFWSTRFEKLA